MHHVTDGTFCSMLRALSVPSCEIWNVMGGLATRKIGSKLECLFDIDIVESIVAFVFAHQECYGIPVGMTF
jgi:hypothetical protein